MLCAGQGLSWAGGTPASASLRSQASRARSFREPETPAGTWLFPRMEDAVSFSSEHLGHLLACFASCERAESGPELRVVCSGGTASVLEMSLCCFLLHHGRSCQWLLLVLPFPVLHVCSRGSLWLKQKGLSWRGFVPHVGHEW